MLSITHAQLYTFSDYLPRCKHLSPLTARSVFSVSLFCFNYSSSQGLQSKGALEGSASGHFSKDFFGWGGGGGALALLVASAF